MFDKQCNFADMLRKPEGYKTGHWWSTTEVPDRLQRKYGKATLKNACPEKIGNTLKRNNFSFQGKHTMAGTEYLMVERE